MKEKTTSPRLKRITIYGCILSIIILACTILMLVFASQHVPTLYSVLCPISLACIFLGGLLVIFYYKELKKITNCSAEYYSRKFPDYLSDTILFGGCFFLTAILSLRDVNISFSTLISLSVGLFSLIFAIFAFVLPTYKKQTEKNNAKLNFYAKKIHNETQLKTLQGKIYKNNQELNHLSTSILTSTIIFLTSFLSYIIFGQVPITYFLVNTSTLFDIIFILRLSLLTHKIYSLNLDSLNFQFTKQEKNLHNRKKYIRKNKTRANRADQC